MGRRGRRSYSCLGCAELRQESESTQTYTLGTYWHYDSQHAFTGTQIMNYCMLCLLAFRGAFESVTAPRPPIIDAYATLIPFLEVCQKYSTSNSSALARDAKVYVKSCRRGHIHASIRIPTAPTEQGWTSSSPGRRAASWSCRPRSRSSLRPPTACARPFCARSTPCPSPSSAPRACIDVSDRYFQTKTYHIVPSDHILVFPAELVA